MLHRLLLLCTAAMAAAAAPSSAQSEWTEIDVVGGRVQHAMAYDSQRDRLVLFGGGSLDGRIHGDTWEWDGAAWRRMASGANGPDPRVGHRMAYDPRRGRVVLFGGSNDIQLYNDTWEWDGVLWSRVARSGPLGRRGHCLSYDAQRGKVVLFGGDYLTGALDDTWEWDGSGWQPVSTATTPGPRTDAAMAFDAVRGETVLFGGRGGPRSRPTATDTWVLDRNGWRQAAAAGGPAPTNYARMEFDPPRGVATLFDTGNGETWTWGGSAWQQMVTGPAPRWNAATAYDDRRQRMLVFAGQTELGDVWTWDGGQWTLVSSNPAPFGSSSAHLTYDAARAEVVLVRGPGTWSNQTDGTYAWDGSRWDLRAVGGPLPRSSFALAHDLVRSETILFGGLSSYPFTALGDTWRWDGASWTQLPGTGPARYNHAMAFDERRGRLVLFGGAPSLSSAAVAETWEWDGSTWSQVVPTSSPGPRSDFAMAYDPIGQRVVLYGGREDMVGETWTYDGTTWTLSPSSGPGPRDKPGLAFDRARRTLVLSGGSRVTNDTWEWDGTQWSQLSPAVISEYGLHTVAHDIARGRTMAFGTFGLWELSPLTPTAPGCTGSEGEPQLWMPSSLPAVNRPLRLEVRQVPAAGAALALLGTLPQQPAIELTSLGLTGCALAVQPVVTFGLTKSGTTALWSTTVPNDPNLGGLVLHAQAVLVDPTANAFGATLSSAGRFWIEP